MVTYLHLLSGPTLGRRKGEARLGRFTDRHVVHGIVRDANHPIEQLQDRYPAYNWSPQASGISVPEPIASELFTQIQKSPEAFGFSPLSPSDVRVYSEGKSKTVTIKTYDRSLSLAERALSTTAIPVPHADSTLKRRMVS